ncbi:hypothetical protein HYT01_01355 [Candidatus Giovannonibacteria bacterium]|nr:hypothetical protein [Candidatus Giovannonibacteria bacterium]
MKLLFLLLISVLLAVFAAHAFAGKREDGMKQVDRALVEVKSTCLYTVKSVGEEGSVVLYSEIATKLGMGFFTDYAINAPGEDSYTLFSSAHIFVCDREYFSQILLENQFTEGAIQLENKLEKVEIKYGAVWYEAVVSKFDSEKEFACLSMALPSGIKPYSLPLLPQNNGLYAVDTEVRARGKMSFKENGLMRLVKGPIEHFQDNFFRFAAPGYHGMSGSPVVLWRKDKYYVIGIVARKFQKDDETINTTLVTDLDFLNKLPK